MLIPVGIRESGAAVTTAWNMECPTCHISISFDYVEYVNIEGWPEFTEVLRTNLLSRVECNGCFSAFDFLSQFILEIPRRNLLVYVTHKGDSPFVEQGFKSILATIDARLTRRHAACSLRRPYTFVHGWDGLKALLDIFEGREVEPRDGPFKHGLTTKEEIRIISGYIYGELFFYDAPHVAVFPVVTALLEFSSSVSETEDVNRIVAMFKDFINILGPIHPWIVQELGSLYVRAGRLEEAEHWLSRAVEMEHRWLAITRTFLDATPKRRADATPQDSDLPHAKPTSVLADVTRSRHIVVRRIPATRDYGLWHFPGMEQASIPEVYNFQRVLAAQGLIHGKLEKAVRDDGWLRSPGTGDLTMLTIRMMQLLEQLSASPESAPRCSYYFHGYLLGRWNLAIGLFRRKGQTNSELTREGAALLRRLESTLAELGPEVDDENFIFFFSTRAAKEIRSFFGW